MAALPSPTQVAGNHSAIYEAYYSQVDPNGLGSVGAMEAARFLKKSGLSDVVLSRVWDLSDPGGRGALDKAGFFVALKLVAMAQSGRDVNLSNMQLQDLPPPKMGEYKVAVAVSRPPPPRPGAITPTPVISQLPAVTGDWAVKPAERDKYDRLYESLQPVNGLIPGNKVKGVLMESKLPFDTLGRIWDLADIDKDGALDRHEFTVAMHLVYKALEKHAIPNVLPPELCKPDGPRGRVPPPAPVTTPAWVVSADDKQRYDVMFTTADLDRDGFVSGLEIKDVFLKSGVPQNVLAHIWALCDTRQAGKLNGEQFALAMWLVERCLRGLEPPLALAPDMLPPSLAASCKPHVENNNTPYSNPELDMIGKDIEELVREKLSLQADVAQKEADVKVKTGEIKSLQSELDTLAATKKQLENQKGEAQKRLNDLKAQSESVVKELAEVHQLVEGKSVEVDKLRTQADEQAEVLRAQESELTSKKEQLENLRKEEERLERQKQDGDGQLDKLTSKLQGSQLQISQAKAKITQLQEQQRQMSDAIRSCESAITAGDAGVVADTALRISPDFRAAEYQLPNGQLSPQQNGFTNGNHDPFNDNSDSGFTDDPFKNTDAFGASDPFAAAFTQPVNDNFQSDPFNEFGKPEKFDPFGEGQAGADKSPAEGDKDPFGCDPFAILHAPVREDSPGPALPPKKSKQPPPRPAPPRPSQPPARPADAFANFADFDSKFSDKAASSSMDFTDDPFRDYRYEDPFNIADPFEEGAAPVASSLVSRSRSTEPWARAGPGGGDDGRSSAPPPSGEERQLEWAAQESLRLDLAERQRRLQEQRDLELAIALSKQDQQTR